MKERDALRVELRHLQGRGRQEPERERELEFEDDRSKLTFATAWINSFEACNQKQLNHCDDVADGFGKMMKLGGHQWSIRLEQKKASPKDLIERAQGGADDAAGRGADTVDMAMVVSHGGLRRKGTDGPLLHITVAFDQDPCRARSHQMRLGDGRLKWLVLDSCRSLELVEAEDITPWTIWRRAFDGLHQIFGFNGVTSDAWWTEDRGKQFAARLVFWDGEMADTWIDAAYSWKMDDYPAAMAVGRTASDADTRLENEKLSTPVAGLSRSDVAAAHWMWRS